MPIVIGAKYSPYSFEDMLKPLAMAQQEYNTVQEGLSTLTDSSNQFSRYLEGTQAGERVKAYNAAIDEAATDMAKNGLKRTNRDTLLGLKRQYNNDIAKINQSAAQLDTLYKGVQAAQLKAQASGDTLFVANMPNVDDLMANPSAAPTMISGMGLQKQGMQAAQSASLRNVLNSTRAGQGVMHMYNEIVQGYGYNSAQAKKFLQDASTIPELQQAIESISTMYGINSLGNGNDSARAKQFIMQGIMDGLTAQQKSTFMQDPEKMAQMQNDYAMQLAQAKAAFEGSSGVGNGIPNQLINGRLNSPSVNEQKETFKKYFTEDGKLTNEGWNAYKGGKSEGTMSAEEAAMSSGMGWAPGLGEHRPDDYSFRDFVNKTMKVKGHNGYIKPSDINNAWKAYNSSTSPAYGDTDSYGTIDVPMKKPASDALKTQLSYALGGDNNDIPVVVDINKDKRSWKTKGTVKMKDLKKNYDIARIQASPFTNSLIVAFTSKEDDDKNVNVELPLGVIAGENSAYMLQSAYSQLEKLEKMPQGTMVSIAGYGQMTKEQAMNLQYKAIQQAMLNTMTYYDQEASKEPR